MLGSTPDPIRAHWASTRIACPFLPWNRKKSTSFPAACPSTTRGGSGITCAVSNALLSSFSAICGNWPTASRNGLEIPSSVWIRIGYTPTAVPASTVSVTFQLAASPLGGGESSLKPNGAISRGFPARLAPLIESSLECPRRTPSGLAALI